MMGYYVCFLWGWLFMIANEAHNGPAYEEFILGITFAIVVIFIRYICEK